LIKLPDAETLDMLFDTTKATMDDYYNNGACQISFLSGEGGALTEASPIDLDGDAFEVQPGSSCKFTLAPVDGTVWVGSVFFRGEKIIPDHTGVYTLENVMENGAVTVYTSRGVYPIEVEGVNIALGIVPKRVNPEGVYMIPFGIPAPGLSITNIFVKNASAVLKGSMIQLSAVSGPVFLRITATAISDLHTRFNASLLRIEEMPEQIVQFRPFRFKIVKFAGTTLKKVEYISHDPFIAPEVIHQDSEGYFNINPLGKKTIVRVTAISNGGGLEMVYHGDTMVGDGLEDSLLDVEPDIVNTTRTVLQYRPVSR
jgi:hypothetical protein